MDTHHGRVSSFTTKRKWRKWPTSFPSAASLAEAGFFLPHAVTSLTNPTVECFHCELSLNDWESTDSPLLRHEEAAPACEWAAIKAQEESGAFDHAPESSEAYEQRLATFKTWPLGAGFPTPEQVAGAGMYFAPSDAKDGRDECRCACCGRRLGGWEEGDDPLKDHARKEGAKCPFVLAVQAGSTSATSSSHSRTSSATSKKSSKAAVHVGSDIAEMTEDDEVVVEEPVPAKAKKGGKKEAAAKGKKATGSKGKKVVQPEPEPEPEPEVEEEEMDLVPTVEPEPEPFSEAEIVEAAPAPVPAVAVAPSKPIKALPSSSSRTRLASPPPAPAPAPQVPTIVTAFSPIVKDFGSSSSLSASRSSKETEKDKEVATAVEEKKPRSKSKSSAKAAAPLAPKQGHQPASAPSTPQLAVAPTSKKSKTKSNKLPSTTAALAPPSPASLPSLIASATTPLPDLSNPFEDLLLSSTGFTEEEREMTVEDFLIARLAARRQTLEAGYLEMERQVEEDIERKTTVLRRLLEEAKEQERRAKELASAETSAEASVLKSAKKAAAAGRKKKEALAMLQQQVATQRLR